MQQYHLLQNQGCLAGVEFEDFVSMCNLRSSSLTPSTPSIPETQQLELEIEERDVSSPILFYPLAQTSQHTLKNKKRRTSSPTFKYTPPSSNFSVRDSLFDMSKPIDSQKEYQEAQDQLWY